MSDDIRHQAAQLLLAERHRQVTKEGWTEQHDDSHDNGCLAMAGAAYAIHATSAAAISQGTKMAHIETARRLFPFSQEDWWKPSAPDDPLRDLVKAGALILAEIERVLRKERMPLPKGCVRCKSCNEIITIEQLGLSFTSGTESVYICKTCAPITSTDKARFEALAKDCTPSK